MKRKETYLISVKPALEGVFHIATSNTTDVYKAKGVSGKNIKVKILRKYE